MNETFWREQLEQLAEHESGDPFDVREDVERGKSRMLRRRVGAAGAGLLVAVVVPGSALVIGGGDTREGSRPGRPVGSGPTAFATFHEPETTFSPSPAAPTSTVDRYERIRAALESSDGPRSPFGPWRHALFETVRDVLDPGGAHLDYSTDSMQASYDPTGVSLGIKLGWTDPGKAGQGMVQIEVARLDGSDEKLCEGAGLTCSRTVRVQGEVMKVGNGDNGKFLVLHRQPDGDRVVVLVDPLFGNNSVTPVKDLGVTPTDVYRLVQDDRLDLPR
ncbi:MAG: hypothetical protein ABIQ59_04890 [Nocardioidaceae bacterium]